MAWITLDEARAACGAEAGAEAVLAWLDGLGAVVKTGHAAATARPYARRFLLLQDVATETREVRGLARGLAEFLADGLRRDDTRERTYYALVSASWAASRYSSVQAVPVSVTAGPDAAGESAVSFWPGGVGSGAQRRLAVPTEGRSVAAEARRANEADGWTLALTETVHGVPYSPDERNVFVPGAVDLMEGGAVVSKASSRTYVFSFGGAVLFQTEETTVTELAFLTRAEAEAAVAANTADASYVSVSRSSGGVTVRREVRSGTQKTASARWVDEERGWTVSVQATAYGHEGW